MADAGSPQQGAQHSGFGPKNCWQMDPSVNQRFSVKIGHTASSKSALSGNPSPMPAIPAGWITGTGL